MSSSIPRRAVRAALPITLALTAAGGVAIAVTGGGPTTISVSPRVLVAAPQDSPADFPGVGRARAREPLPGGYVAVSRDVRFTRGGDAAYAALRMVCPRGRSWRTGTATGAVGLTVLDRTVSGKRSVLVMATFDSRSTALGQTAAGTIHALCR